MGDADLHRISVYLLYRGDGWAIELHTRISLCNTMLRIARVLRLLMVTRRRQRQKAADHIEQKDAAFVDGQQEKAGR